MDAVRKTLAERFGLEALRPGQTEAVTAMLGGRDLVAVMPTGAGKSLCFQLPALLSGGTTVVVSPLIALMKDQVDRLRGRGIRAAAIHSGLAPEERQAAEAELATGCLELVYVAPERLASSAFQGALARTRVSRLVVDEAHCISQWGHDFRPDYRRIGPLRASLGVPAAAFTATATPEVRRDIVQQLGLHDAVELVTGFDRPNLTLAVDLCRGNGEKVAALDRVLREVGGPGIVYAATRKHVEQWGEHLADLGLRAGCYHAGLTDAERTAVQDGFLDGRLEVIAATNAFGMGVDKRDIRFVVHADLPGSVEAYYQEAGRAGRDGLPARCTLLFSPADVRTQEFFLESANPDAATVRTAWQLLGDGASEDELQERIGPDPLRRRAAVTAARLLRRAAESTRRPLGEGAPPLDLRQRDAKLQRDRARLATIVRFAYAKVCRTRFVYDYFAGSAQGGVAPRCGTCDVCLGWGRRPTREPTDAEAADVRAALAVVGRLSERFGTERIAQVLTGSTAHELVSRRLDRVPGYGSLAARSLDEVKRLLELVADAGLVERHGIAGARPGATVLAITPAGRQALDGGPLPPLAFPAAAPRPTTRSGGGRGSAGPAAASDDPLVQRLKAWRAEEARRRNVPAYVVFHDATLVALAAARPADRRALLGVRGVGPAKVAAYGDALLALLA